MVDSRKEPRFEAVYGKLISEPDVRRNIMVYGKNDLLSTLHQLPEMIETYLKNIPEEFLDKKRNEDSWTIREHLYHIVNVQEMLYQRLLKIRDEENPVITPYFPENETERAELYKSLEEAFLFFKKMREKQILLIKQLQESDFAKEATHGEYIRYNIPIILNHMIFHEYWHMYRIEELWLAKEEYI